MTGYRIQTALIVGSGALASWGHGRCYGSPCVNTGFTGLTGLARPSCSIDPLDLFQIYLLLFFFTLTSLIPYRFILSTVSQQKKPPFSPVSHYKRGTFQPPTPTHHECYVRRSILCSIAPPLSCHPSSIFDTASQSCAQRQRPSQPRHSQHQYQCLQWTDV